MAGTHTETLKPAGGTVLTCYVPRRESDRANFVDDAWCYRMGETVVALIDRWFPGAQGKIEEVRIYRRGHAMCLSTPGATTRIAPKVREPLGKLFFAHSDSQGDVTDFSTAHRAAMRASLEVRSELGM